MTTETSTSPNNKSSLASWWKTFKKRNPVVDDVNSQQHNVFDSKRELTADVVGAGTGTGSGAHHTGSEPDKKAVSTPHQQSGLVGPRPILRYKSRSSNYVRPSSVTNASPSSTESLRAHRDSYLQSQKAKNNVDSQVFGVPLEKVLSLASVNISISEDLANEGIQYGTIPVVVGKCCVFLKKNGTEVEGVFRVGGASRRVKELQFLFSTPPDYGRRLDWDGYTVHDAASLLRRFLNSLPEPLIPLALYEQFREPLSSRPIVCKFLSRKGVMRKASEPKETPEEETVADDAASATASQTAAAIAVAETTVDETNEQDMSQDHAKPEQETADVAVTEEEKVKKNKKVKKYKKLIGEIHNTLDDYSLLLNELPPASQHLLFYILDLLTVFATHSSKNLMSNKNLAAIFQPSILSHPDHDMSPEEYALSAQVVEFLLEYYRRLLEATQKIQSERAAELARQKPVIPALQITTDNDSIRKGGESDASVNTPITPSSTQLHPPLSKRGTRKHSKSLSSVNAPPDGLKSSATNAPLHISDDKVLLQQYNSNTDVDDSDAEAIEKIQTPTTQMFPIDHHDELLSPPQKPFSPVGHKKSVEALNMTANSSSAGNSSSLFHNFKRPLSAVFSNKDKNLSIEDIVAPGDDHEYERETRWDQSEDHPKKDNWFNRLRSRSRSSEPRSTT